MTVQDRYAHIIAQVAPSHWWTLDQYKASIDAVRPAETQTDWNSANLWADAARAAVARFKEAQRGGTETGDLFGGENHD